MDDAGFEGFLLQKGEDFLGVVALDFEGAVLDGAAGGEGGFEEGAEFGQVVGGVVESGDEGDEAAPPLAFAFFEFDFGELVGRRGGVLGGEGVGGGARGRLGHFIFWRELHAAAVGGGFSAVGADGRAVEGGVGEEAGHLSFQLSVVSGQWSVGRRRKTKRRVTSKCLSTGH